MIDLDSDLLILHIEFDITDRPWRGQARNMLVEFFGLAFGAPFPKVPTITHSKPGWIRFSSPLFRSFGSITFSIDFLSFLTNVLAYHSINTYTELLAGEGGSQP